MKDLANFLKSLYKKNGALLCHSGVKLDVIFSFQKYADILLHSYDDSNFLVYDLFLFRLLYARSLHFLKLNLLHVILIYKFKSSNNTVSVIGIVLDIFRFDMTIASKS